ncbi:hypothetical protein O179_00665 [Chlamydia trachomatis]|nr:hypothetical protein O179_00665 [Chlamydia trachomatis]
MAANYFFYYVNHDSRTSLKYFFERSKAVFEGKKKRDLFEIFSFLNSLEGKYSCFLFGKNNHQNYNHSL